MQPTKANLFSAYLSAEPSATGPSMLAHVFYASACFPNRSSEEECPRDSRFFSCGRQLQESFASPGAKQRWPVESQEPSCFMPEHCGRWSVTHGFLFVVQGSFPSLVNCCTIDWSRPWLVLLSCLASRVHDHVHVPLTTCMQIHWKKLGRLAGQSIGKQIRSSHKNPSMPDRDKACLAVTLRTFHRLDPV